jgi:hypothetical protein
VKHRPDHLTIRSIETAAQLGAAMPPQCLRSDLKRGGDAVLINPARDQRFDEPAICGCWLP